MHNLLNGNNVSGADNEAIRLQLVYRPNDKLKIGLNSKMPSRFPPVVSGRRSKEA